MLWFTCSLGVDHFLTKKGGQTCSKETSDIQRKWKKKILIKVKWMWSLGPPVISLYVLIQSAGLLFCVFLLCAYNLAVCVFLLFDLECFGSIFQQANIKGVVENMTLVLVVEDIVNFTGFIKKRSCQLLLFLKDARTHFQVWCIFLGWTSSNLI